ncbi:hypothetical protein NEF87_003377 [Candidatus Lokiarchaeum ossiferum]|uniref:Glycerophosphoryl diester phosphodiesterase membrane domain-containing protein n=1 Tax=Candidatus Lokiarchaeum ossiferum TaxID=2951803 RepID=A0ABY6HXL5_9ARCH|nr:hypothetical protein NEF87_003377 [Candidatus Lokiarchaeum sp. B-35]
MIRDSNSIEKPESHFWIDFNIFNFIKIIRTNTKLRTVLILFSIFQFLVMTLLTIFQPSGQFILGLIPGIISLLIVIPFVVSQYAQLQKSQNPKSPESIKSESYVSVFRTYFIVFGTFLSFGVILGGFIYGIVFFVSQLISFAYVGVFFIILEVLFGLMSIILVYIVINFFYIKLKQPQITFRKNLQNSWIDAKNEWQTIYGQIFSRSFLLIPLLLLEYIVQFGGVWLIFQIVGSEVPIGGLFNPDGSFVVLFVEIFILNGFLLLMNFIFIQRIHEKNR